MNSMRSVHCTTWLLLPLTCTLVLTGCAVPWMYHQWPEFSGVITRGGKPIADAKVRYSTDRKAVDCDPAPNEVASPDESKAFNYYSEAVITSPDGEFQFQGSRSLSLHLWYPIPGIAEYLAYWDLCVETPDGQRYQKRVSVDWGGMLVDMPESTPDAVKIVGKCDLSSSEICASY